jgi:hypothetical protein
MPKQLSFSEQIRKTIGAKNFVEPKKAAPSSHIRFDLNEEEKQQQQEPIVKAPKKVAKSRIPKSMPENEVKKVTKSHKKKIDEKSFNAIELPIKKIPGMLKRDKHIQLSYKQMVKPPSKQWEMVPLSEKGHKRVLRAVKHSRGLRLTKEDLVFEAALKGGSFWNDVKSGLRSVSHALAPVANKVGTALLNRAGDMALDAAMGAGFDSDEEEYEGGAFSFQDAGKAFKQLNQNKNVKNIRRTLATKGDSFLNHNIREVQIVLKIK